MKIIPRIRQIILVENRFEIIAWFNTNEQRKIDFLNLFEKWNLKASDLEFPLKDYAIFKQVKLVNGTLSWDNIKIELLDENKQPQFFPLELDAVVLYENSELMFDKILQS